MLTVKSKITLEFLGDDYAKGYIVVKAVPMSEYENLVKRSEKLSESSPKEALEFVRDTVLERFIEGEIPQDDETVAITKDNLLDLPGEAFVEAFARMTGRSSPNS